MINHEMSNKFKKIELQNYFEYFFCRRLVYTVFITYKLTNKNIFLYTCINNV